MLKELMMLGAMIMPEQAILEEIKHQIEEYKKNLEKGEDSEETKLSRKKLCTIMTMFLTKTIAGDTPEAMQKFSQKIDKAEKLDNLFKDDIEAAN